MVYKSGQIFLPFCHNSRVWQTERRTDRILIARPRLHSMQRAKNERMPESSFYMLSLGPNILNTFGAGPLRKLGNSTNSGGGQERQFLGDGAPNYTKFWKDRTVIGAFRVCLVFRDTLLSFGTRSQSPHLDETVRVRKKIDHLRSSWMFKISISCTVLKPELVKCDKMSKRREI